ncbi:E4 SUMO-protein ligase PIAL2 [Quillaja saponaria]|uniref:E4 SUMO-protein ligase PIAL2 n=1 Tax=Quillaja saponaria TaxID=32244 RepID=A0AAD7KSL8_QUISA|nr:E4 SUMO-protein ligase PIAL2 [Quillaja saponaria]
MPVMSGTMLTPPPASGTFSGPSIGLGNQLSPSVVNSFRVGAVTEKLAVHVQPGYQGEAAEFFNLCLSLSRGIDYAIANNEIPGNVQDLPKLLKQICQRKNDLFLQAGIMVLMVSVKNASKIGWFPKKESDELLSLANEIGRSYCNMGDVNDGPSNCDPTVSTIMERYYPRMRMGCVLASLEVKPGYGAFMIDFHISKNTEHSPQEKIQLFVAQTDSTETSACLINPQQVNFLLNGKAIEKRTNPLMDPGPQMPTNVTAMLKYGTNLLQAVGQFNGHYAILVAYMSWIASPNTPVLQDYAQHPVSVLDLDAEIIEGPSRISLNCPISYTRIKIPVKGRLCKHLRCFDFSNFVNINSRRPSWRCPHCNQYVCYSDLRLDRNMVEVLREVVENVVEVIICADGSWKAVLENDDLMDKTHNKTHNYEKEQTEPLKSASSQKALSNVLDLTEDDDQMDIMNTCEAEDRKPLLTNLQNQSINHIGINQNVHARVEDDFWSGVYFSPGSVVSSGRSDPQGVGGISQSIPANFVQPPVLTDAISPALNREAEGHGNAYVTNSVMQNQFSTPNNYHLQQLNFLNSVGNNEYGRSQLIPRHIGRTPVAVQALPAQSQALGPQQRSRPSFSSLTSSSSSVTAHSSISTLPAVDGIDAILSDTERQQHFCRPPMNPLQVSDIASVASQRHSTAQNQAPLAATVPVPSQLRNVYRTLSRPLSDFRNSHLQQTFNSRTSQSAAQPASITRQASHLQRSQIQQGGAQVGIGHAVTSGSSQHPGVMAAAHMARQSPSVPVQNQASRVPGSFNVDSFRTPAGMAQSLSRTDGLPEESWRPTGRMRGSLSGRPYSDALRELIIQPTQSVQTARSQTVHPSGIQPTQPDQTTILQSIPPPVVPSQLQVLLANNRGAHDPQSQNISG